MYSIQITDDNCPQSSPVTVIRGLDSVSLLICAMFSLSVKCKE